ncbi:MAG: polyribonucleotide nucleotidyltransferase [SAR324 cluster bacterium]|uniref:Polyribonucleotide nucleotidyltransferase n=1 Tax=SAR324 cluster bacterium TaxID=2024889 RepID=A0A7X9FNT7_9DELT|nr:polyribonucleotide nucleotidyltransferase [SAR324 cluster bacterium]
MQIVERELFGHKFSIETGRIAKQAGGSVVVRVDDAMVLVTACAGEEREIGDFLPLTIDYFEKTYAAGKIPGGFFKREGKQSERETLVSRLMDRPCRPLFPKGFNKEIQVIATVISADQENETDALAVCGASAALTLSELPFEGPIAAVRVGRIDGQLLINPTISQLEKSDINFIVAGSQDAIVMVEGGADQVPEADVLEALFFAHKEMQPIIEMQLELQKQCGKKKVPFTPKTQDAALLAKISAKAKPLVEKAIQIKDKMERRDAYRDAKAALITEFVNEDDPKAAQITMLINHCIEEHVFEKVRERIVKEGSRIDGRDVKTVRPIDIEVGLLPRTHGSALFTRGETQALAIATLGTKEEAQRLDNLAGEDSKTFMLHYNFPPFSVGETKPMRGPGRREVGHGALAHRAISAVIPDMTKFPYVIRVVSEITESNGSSSMATVCGTSLALMDAGVPIKAPVAGVAMGLIKEGDEFVVLTDILGDEDHLGDMDFKVCGTDKGVTALQMDIKIKGLNPSILEKAMEQAKDARLHILSKMNAVISEPRGDLSRYAPRIVTIKINPEKIKDVIGPGGKTIRSITESCDVKMDVSDDGTVSISSADESKVRAAVTIIENMTRQAEVGKVYKGIVKRIADFGAFVEILPGTDGLVHISQLADERVNRVTDIVKEGDEVMVKVLEVDRQGKIRLSLKDNKA